MQFNRQTFFNGVRDAFGPLNQDQVDGLEFLLGAFERDNVWQDTREIAYALATVKHETANTFHPIYERGSRHYFDKYDGRRDLGNIHPGDGYRYRGAGFVQITGRKNYARFGIENHPEDALEPQTAFDIMSTGMHHGSFTGAKLSQFIHGDRCDYYGARTIINGHDDAVLIAGYASKFERILNDSLSSAASVSPFDSPAIDTPTPPSETDTPTPDDSAGTAPVTNAQQPVTNITADTVVTTGDTAPTPPPTSAVSLEAPPTNNSVAKSATLTIGGFAVPGFLVGIVTAIKSAIENGFISATDVGNAVLNFISNNTKYAFGLIGCVIVLLTVKHITKHVTLWMSMHSASRVDMNTVTVNKPQ